MNNNTICRLNQNHSLKLKQLCRIKLNKDWEEGLNKCIHLKLNTSPEVLLSIYEIGKWSIKLFNWILGCLINNNINVNTFIWITGSICWDLLIGIQTNKHTPCFTDDSCYSFLKTTLFYSRLISVSSIHDFWLQCSTGLLLHLLVNCFGLSILEAGQRSASDGGFSCTETETGPLMNLLVSMLSM